MAVIKIGEHNEVVVPKDVRERLGVKPGDFVKVTFESVETVPYTDEELGPETRESLRQAEEDLKAGRVTGPYRTAEEVQAYLDSLKDSK